MIKNIIQKRKYKCQKRDWKNNYISVSKTIHYLPTDNGKYRQDITSPKTKNAVRKIPMLEEVRQALEEQRQNQIKFGIPTDCVIDGYSGFIFTTSLGKPYLSDGINSIIKRVRKKYNRTEIAQAEKENRPPILLPDFSPHIMRHTFCTRLCECDLNLKAIQSIMGHGSVKTSMDIYTHVSENKKQQEIKKLDKRIEQFIAHGYKEIDLTKEEYESLKPETKNLIKLNNIKVNIK